MSHASQQYAFTEPRTVKRAQVKPSEREHQTSSSAPRVSLAPAADRTLDILEFIASNGQTQAATLARELGIPRSTVYQLLEILERHGLVTRLAEQRAYGIGLKTFELGSAYSRQHRVSQVAHPVLARLVDETGENGHLAVLHGNEIIYVIEERAAHRPPRVSGVGVRLPSHLTATGRAILSALPRNQVRALYPNRKTFTDRTGIGPNVARTNIVSSSVWGVFSFTLNGTVFILLGMLLPNAMSTSWDDPHVSNWLLLVAILTVSAVVIVMRFLWISLMLRLARDTVTGKRRKMTAQRWRSAAVMTFGGPKGTITLSLMFTIPYTITGGAWFPMRDELIFIAGGVIVVTLLLANFLLPLLAPNRNKDTSVEMTEITIEVLRRTVEELTGRVTPDNRRAVLMIIDSYTKRITRLKQRIGEIDPQGYMQLQIDALNWEKEYVKERLAKVKASPNDDKAAHDLEIEACERLLDQIMSSLRHIETEHNSGRTIWRVKGRFRALQRRMGTMLKRVNSRIRRTTPLFSDDELFAHTRVVQVDAIEHVIDRLYEEMGRNTYNTEHCSALLLDYRRGEATLRSRPNVGTSAEAQAQAEDVKRESYGIELGVIQDMYEAGDITRAQSKQLRRNVYVMSVDADAQI